MHARSSLWLQMLVRREVGDHSHNQQGFSLLTDVLSAEARSCFSGSLRITTQWQQRSSDHACSDSTYKLQAADRLETTSQLVVWIDR